MFYVVLFLLESDRERPQLTDLMLENLSKIITEPELRALAINGLGLDGVNVQKYLGPNPKHITSVASKLLREWSASQNSRQIAYKELCKSLKRNNLQHYVPIVLKPMSKYQTVKSGVVRKLTTLARGM